MVKGLKNSWTKRAGNPIFKVLFPSVDKVRWQQARVEAWRALFTAAITVQLDGPDALKTQTDPVSGQPWDYVPSKNGFELRSRLKGPGNKPVALTVGRREK